MTKNQYRSSQYCKGRRQRGRIFPLLHSRLNFRQPERRFLHPTQSGQSHFQMPNVIVLYRFWLPQEGQGNIAASLVAWFWQQNKTCRNSSRNYLILYILRLFPTKASQRTELLDRYLPRYSRSQFRAHLA